MRKWLYEKRKNKDYTQRQVAEAANISQPSYHAIETGENAPKPATAKKIAAFLGFDWTLFFDEMPDEKRDEQ